MKFAVATLILLLFLGHPTNAQVAGGAITGTVSSEAGSAVPGVNISVKEVTTGQSRSVTTNTAGLYNVPDLSAGSFEMTVSAPGFTDPGLDKHYCDRGRGAHPERGHEGRQGRAGCSRRRTARSRQRALPLNLRKRQRQTIRDTPLNGRDWAALATLQAGVSPCKRQRLGRRQYGSRLRGRGEYFRIASR